MAPCLRHIARGQLTYSIDQFQACAVQHPARQSGPGARHGNSTVSSSYSYHSQQSPAATAKTAAAAAPARLMAMAALQGAPAPSTSEQGPGSCTPELTPQQHAAAAHVLAVVVMGVSGCGKSTVGSLLAERLNCRFADADHYHPPFNVAKMSAGLPLDDQDRHPWLLALRNLIAQHLALATPPNADDSVSTSTAADSSSSSSTGWGGGDRGSGGSSCARVGEPVQKALPVCGAGQHQEQAEERQEGKHQGQSSPAAALQTADGSTAGVRLVLACSALKPHYRNLLACGDDGMGNCDGGDGPSSCGASAQAYGDRGPMGHADPRVGFVLLDPPPQLLAQRLQRRAERGGHFMPPSLLPSQLAALQYDETELLLHVRGCSGSDGSGSSGCEGRSDGTCEGEQEASMCFPSAEVIAEVLAAALQPKPFGHEP